MDGPFNPLAFPVMLRAPSWLPPDVPADSRQPFAMLVVALLQPAQVVELGVGCGETYAALCQAVQALGLASQCLGVELNHLPDAPGSPPPAAAEFRPYHAAQYGSFSRLVSAEAAAAAAYFSDGSVDLLHLAGSLDSAQAAEAFRQWLPKLSARAAVLVSHIHPAEGAQGLAAFWAETRPDCPRFELQQGQGLGLLLLGAEPPEALVRLTHLPPEQQAALRELAYRLGQAAASTAEPGGALPGQIRSLEARLAQVDPALTARQAEVAALKQTLREQTEHVDQLQGRLEIVTAREREIRGLYLDLHQQLVARDQIAWQVVETDRIVSERDAVIAARDNTIATLQTEQAQAQAAAAAERERLLAARDEIITGLRAELALAQAEIRTIHGGKIWGLAVAWWRLRGRLNTLFSRPSARAQ